MVIMEKIKVPEHILSLARATKYYEEDHKTTSYASSYEATSTHPLYVLAQYFLTRTGEGRRKISWSLMLKLGINPLELDRRTVSNPYDISSYGAAWRFSKKPHPLLLAAVFDDPEAPISSDAFIDRMHEDYNTEYIADPKKTLYALDTHHGGLDFDAKECCFLVPPPRTESRVRVGLDFRAELAAWYSVDVIADQIERNAHGGAALIRRVADTLKDAGYDTTVMQRAALKYLKRATDKHAATHGFRQYGELAMLMRHCDRAELLALLGEKIKKKHVHAVLGVAMPDAPSDIMVQAIRAHCGVGNYSAMKYMSRSPTIAELQQCRLKGLMNVLWHMPWPILEPLIRTYEGDIRALLLKEAPDNLDKARQVFSDHQNRIVLVPDNIVEMNKDRQPGNFTEFKHGIRSRYAAAQRLHRELQRLPPEVAILVLMDHIVAVPHLAEVRALREDRALAEALDAWKTPITTEGYPGGSSERYRLLPY